MAGCIAVYIGSTFIFILHNYNIQIYRHYICIENSKLSFPWLDSYSSCEKRLI